MTPTLGAVDSPDDFSREATITKSEVDDWYLSNNFERFDLNDESKLDGHERNRYAKGIVASPTRTDSCRS